VKISHIKHTSVYLQAALKRSRSWPGMCGECSLTCLRPEVAGQSCGLVMNSNTALTRHQPQELKGSDVTNSQVQRVSYFFCLWTKTEHSAAWS